MLQGLLRIHYSILLSSIMSSSARSLRPRSAKTELLVTKNSEPEEKLSKKRSPRKRKDATDLPKNKQGAKSKSEDSASTATDAKQSKLELPKTTRKRSASPRTRQPSNVVKTDDEVEVCVNDIEDGGWEPEHWKQVWENILKMRKLHLAPVDSLGCAECAEKDVAPEVFRYQTLISVMLSSQTRDEVTHAATQKLIKHGLTVDNIINTPDETIGELIYPAGFWKSKVRFIKQTSQVLKDKYNGDIPQTFEELCELPGVGPKMANIVMSVGWNNTVGIAVDTHVHRISNRLGWVKKPTKEPEQTRKALESWLPKKLWRPVNITLVGFGQTVCKPVSPSCESCLNKNICPFGKKMSKKKK